MGTLVAPAARAEIGDFLVREPGLSQIDFYIGTNSRIHVTANELRKVGELIKSGAISVQTDDAYLAKKEHGGEYSARKDQITLWTADTATPLSTSAKGMIVHEAVHAARDLAGLIVLRIRDECAAIIAQMIYLRETNVFADILQGNTNYGDKVAAQIVNSFELYTKRGVHLKSQDVRLLAKWLKDDRGFNEASRVNYNGVDF